MRAHNFKKQMKNQKGKNNPNFKDGRCSTKHYCIEGCGREISYPTWRYGKRRCGSCCKKGNKNNKFIDGRKTTTHFCIEQDCNNEISYNNWRIGNKRCIKCSNQGEYNSNWQNGISKLPYAFDFTPELRESIRTRDNFECQNCGMTEEEHLIVRGTVLDIHHIDYDKMNSKENNLITTCNSCNTRANYNRDYWKSFYQSKMLEILNKKE
jgi:hypothetical protein